MRRRAPLGALLLAALALLSAALPAGAGCREGEVAFRTARGEIRFHVELAATEAARRKGLMQRRHLARDAGMLFLWPRPARVSFWMHDTLIPLDMIFVDAQGRVSRVHADARPFDDTPIPGGSGVLAVVELNAGAAARAGIRPGTVMRAAAMPQERALWRCD